jgi:hypothetical protein
VVKGNFNSEFILIDFMREFYTMETDKGLMCEFLSFNQVIESLKVECESFFDEFITLALEDEAVGSIF